MVDTIYNALVEAKKSGKKSFAVLIDPDRMRLDRLADVIDNAIKHKVDFLFLGGSLIVNDTLHEVLLTIKKRTSIPCILFPGNPYQINDQADGILLLSLISGRNPDLLIGQHVLAAPYLKESNLEILPTGYLLIDGGVPTTASYISNSAPIPSNKPDIAFSTALAGEMLGLKLIFLDAGSGAVNPVPNEMIRLVKSSINIPLIVGGGIKTAQRIRNVLEAGADLVVVGNTFEKDPTLIAEFSSVFEEYNKHR